MATHKSAASTPKSVAASKSPPQLPAPKKTDPRAASAMTAVEMGARQREISVSEFFTKNRHLLGFDNPRKALLTCVKEAVDNALDACEEAGILPDVTVQLEVVPTGGATPPVSQATRFRITVTDNGRGLQAARPLASAPVSISVNRFPESLRSSCTAPSFIACA